MPADQRHATRAASLAVLAMIGACGHVPKVIQATTVVACEGARPGPVGRPTWATATDLDGDRRADLLLLDVHAPADSGAWASIVPLRATDTGYCRDDSLPVWQQPLAVPSWVSAVDDPDILARLMRIRADDLDGDGRQDVIVYNPVTCEVAVLVATGDPRSAFAPIVRLQPAPRERRASSQLRERWHEPDLAVRDDDGDGDLDLVIDITARGGIRHLAGDGRSFEPGAAFGIIPEITLGSSSRVLAARRSRERWDTARADASGRVYVTSPEFTAALAPGSRPPPSGTRRIATPFRADYAVYVDYVLDDSADFRTLVIGAGTRLAVQEQRTTPHRWRVLDLR